MKKIPRRKFLQYGGIAVSAAAMGEVYGATRKISPGDVISLGIIGTGSRGAGIAAELQQVPEFKIMACCDILPDRLEQGLGFADKNAKGYKDYRQLLDDRSVDAVVIATPLYLHHEMALQAMAAGKHIYCEKTMAYNYDQVFDLAKKAAAYKGVFQIGHQYRNTPMYHKVKEIIDKGIIGKVVKYTCPYHRNDNWRRPVSDPKLERIINWRMYREYSAGLVSELSSHQLDVVNWMTGSQPTRVTGFGGIDYWKDGREIYDNINLIYEYPGGVRVNVTSMLSNAYDDYRLEILGDKGTIVIGWSKARIHPEAAHLKEGGGQDYGLVDGVTGATMKDWKPGQPIDIPFDDQGKGPTVHAFLGFADCIRQGKRPFSNEETGMQAALAVHMGNEAMDKGEVIHWKDRIKNKG